MNKQKAASIGERARSRILRVLAQHYLITCFSSDGAWLLT